MKNKTLWKQVGAAAIAAAMVMSTVPATPVQAAGGKTLAVSSQKQLNQALKTVLPVKQKTTEKEQRLIWLKPDPTTAKALLGELQRQSTDTVPGEGFWKHCWNSRLFRMKQ